MKTFHAGLIAAAALLSMTASQASADVRLPKVLTDHMVLQRDMPIHLWGWAYAGEAVTVDMDKDHASATADKAGRWSVTLPARAAGGPWKIIIAGKNKLELNDILMGDVWVASGQSNMEMPMAGFTFNKEMVIKNGPAEIAAANYPLIRLFHIKNEGSPYPLDDLKTTVAWQVCSPETVSSFSAVGFFFGRDIYLEEKIPIGLIDSTWGGTPAEAWASMDGLSQSAVLDDVMQVRAADMDHEDSMLQQKAEDARQAKVNGTVAPKSPSDRLIAWDPAGLYNAMIAPLVKMPIKGVIWYQGESNTGPERAAWYGPLFETMITDWRTHWKQPDLPFLFVQIADYTAGPGWPIVQDQQRRTLALKNTGMAVANDVGEEHQIHPAQKQIVAHRLVLNALDIAYGQHVISTGPLFRSATPSADSITITFDSAAGLKAVGGPLGGFEVAGADGVFSPAEATIIGETVVVKSHTVPRPAFVRYAWASFPKGANLYNGADLPTSAFTSQ